MSRSAAFTGTGLVSMKSASMSGRYRSWSARAIAASPFAAASQRSAIARGMTFAATEITPVAPASIIGSVSASSPDTTPMSHRLRICFAWSTDPLASLIATIVGIFDAANSWDIETGALAAERATRQDVKTFGAMLARSVAYFERVPTYLFIPGGVLVIEDSGQYAESAEIRTFLDRFPEDFHEPFFRDYLKDDLAPALEGSRSVSAHVTPPSWERMTIMSSLRVGAVKRSSMTAITTF